MVLLTVFLEIIVLGLMVFFFYLSTKSWEHEFLFGTIGVLFLLMAIIVPITIDEMHGYIDYIESNDKDKARITAVTQVQEGSRVYYKVEVEYLTNTPTQSGMITNYNIEKDTFYCYITDEELVEQLKKNMYKELWIISGYKGGYETYKDFGTKLIKGIELIEEET